MVIGQNGSKLGFRSFDKIILETAIISMLIFWTRPFVFAKDNFFAFENS